MESLGDLSRSPTTQSAIAYTKNLRMATILGLWQVLFLGTKYVKDLKLRAGPLSVGIYIPLCACKNENNYLQSLSIWWVYNLRKLAKKKNKKEKQHSYHFK